MWTMSARRGFTLVELLVVIAIIALLISILAPSLNAAKDLAKNTMCMTNLHAVALGLNLYSEANRGNIPPHFRNGAFPAAVYYTYCAFKGDEPVDPTDGLIGTSNVGRRSYGFVYTIGAITEPGLLYCPLSPVAFGQFKTYPKPWGSAMPSEGIGTGHIRTSYMYNPNINDTCTAYTAGLQLSTFDRYHPLTLDILCRSGTFGHTMGGYRWNMGYADGRADSKGSPGITKLIQTDTFPDQAENDWPAFNVLYQSLMEGK